MTTKVRTNVYLDKDLKDKAKKIFKAYGLSLSDALNLFLAQVVKKSELPLEEIIPEETLKVIREAREGKNIKQLTYEEFKDLVNETIRNS